MADPNAHGWQGLPQVEYACAVAVGVFDGVHRGHLRLMDALCVRARTDSLTPAVVTFRNHPRSVLQRDFRPAYLCSMERRMQLLRSAGAEAVVALDFTTETASIEAAEFVDALTGQMGMRALVVGPDFALGRGRKGDLPFLRRMGADSGFTVDLVEPLFDLGNRIDSTSIRSALSSGDVEAAAQLLGRPFELTGTVVRGHGRGTPLGFPTANLDVDEGYAVPASGIYAAWGRTVGPDGREMMCAVCIGTNPTFGGGQRTIEAFVLDFDGDLYGERFTLDFVRRLRDEERYETVGELTEQVRRDVDMTRSVLAGGT